MKVKMIAVSVVVAVAFSGCSLRERAEFTHNVESWDKAAATKLDEYAPDRVFGKLAEQKIEPKIRGVVDDHSKLDPFFAMPNAHSKEEAEEQVVALHEATRFLFSEENLRVATSKKLNFYYRTGCGMAIFHEQLNKHGTLFIKGKYAYGTNCKEVVMQKLATLTLKPVKLGDTWYLVVSDTNAKNRGFVGNLFNAFKLAAQDKLDSDTEVKTNAFIVGITNSVIFKAMQRNPELKENFVNVQNCSGTMLDKLCPNDPREEEYKKKFQEAIKAAGL